MGIHQPVSYKIQQVIQPGGTPTSFPFGAHQTIVTYPQGFSNPNGNDDRDGDADGPRPVLPDALLGTQFANEQCIVYRGTGGD